MSLARFCFIIPCGLYSGCQNNVPFRAKSGSGIFLEQHINPEHHLCPTDW